MSGATRRITVLYFAAVRDRAGTDREDLDLPAEIVDVRAFSAWLERKRPRLLGRLAQCRFAVDEEFRDPSFRIEPDAVVAIIPPVSGG